MKIAWVSLFFLGHLTMVAQVQHSLTRVQNSLDLLVRSIERGSFQQQQRLIQEQKNRINQLSMQLSQQGSSLLKFQRLAQQKPALVHNFVKTQQIPGNISDDEKRILAAVKELMTTKSITIDELESLLNAIKQGQQLTVPDQPLDSPHEPPSAGGPPPPLAGGPPPPFGGPPPPGTSPSGQSVPQHSQPPAVSVALTEADKKNSDQALIQAIKAIGVPANGTVESLTNQLLNISTKVKKSKEEKDNYQETMGKKLSELLPSSPSPDSVTLTLRNAREAIKKKNMQQQLIPILQVLAFDASSITLDSVSDFLKHILINLFSAWRLKNESTSVLNEKSKSISDKRFMSVFYLNKDLATYIPTVLDRINVLRISPSYLKYVSLQEDLGKKPSTIIQPSSEESSGGKVQTDAQKKLLEELKKRQQAQQIPGEEIVQKTVSLLVLPFTEVIQNKDLIKTYFENINYMSRYLFYPLSIAQDNINEIVHNIEQSSGSRPSQLSTKAIESWQINKLEFKDVFNKQLSQIKDLKELAIFIMTLIESASNDDNRAEFQGYPLVNLPLGRAPKKWVKFDMPINDFNEKIKELEKLKNNWSSIIVQAFIRLGFVDGSSVNDILSKGIKVENTLQNLLDTLKADESFTKKVSDLLSPRYVLIAQPLKEVLFSINRNPSLLKKAFLDIFTHNVRPGQLAALDVLKRITVFIDQMPATYSSIIYLVSYFADQVSKTNANFNIIKQLINDLDELNNFARTSDETAQKTGSQTSIGEIKLKGKLTNLIQLLSQGLINNFYQELHNYIVRDSGLPDNDLEGMNTLNKEFTDFQQRTMPALIQLILAQPLSRVDNLISHINSLQSLPSEQQIKGLELTRGMGGREVERISKVYQEAAQYFKQIKEVLHELLSQQPFAWTSTEKQRVKQTINKIIEQIANNTAIENRYKASLQDYFTSIQTMTDQL